MLNSFCSGDNIVKIEKGVGGGGGDWIIGLKYVLRLNGLKVV